MGKFWKSVGKAIASIPIVGNAIKGVKKTAATVKKEVKKVAQKVETAFNELKESAEELLEELEEAVEEALGKVTTYARKLKNNLEELALVQWVKNDAKNFVLSAYKKTKNWVKGGWKEGLSMGLDFLPIVGNIKASYESAYGKDPITGRKLSTAERAIAGAAILGGPLVKGAKHLGKGALKIIPGSDKLVQGVSKSFTKVKEGGKQIIDKVAVKAKELKAEANVMMAKAKQGIQEQMDHLGGLLRRNDPIPATAGGPSVKNVPVKDRDSTVQRSTGNSSGARGSVKGSVNANHPIRTYRNADLKKLEEKYTADPRITIEMPYVGKGKPGTNAEGWLRDKDFYWKEIMNKYPETLSKANKQKIDLGFSPINDKTFREHFPQYDMKELYNDKLIHHHVGGGGQAVAVPSKLHPGTGGIHNAEKAAGVWGNDSEYAKLLEKFLNK
ncbi:pre-toxin TG domain-containing protein [Metasolibacillus meyeri]|uniref:Pre-toxin TG domain-containing protein n=1 Tax=Metasolibacillus meyeri TaxID=1071052 RepID=A0AAW9NUG1_9BACL|nr:pre-toxin TG domain-containing protein [Metasolibacillus meyeri]MEC1180057.1 pre-toxin TG domain-containing protein [Metasolibacillus meyeri]